MAPVEIKVLLLRRGLTITALAREFGCWREELSYCVHHKRHYPALRKKLAKKLGMSVGELFGSEVQKRESAA